MIYKPANEKAVFLNLHRYIVEANLAFFRHVRIVTTGSTGASLEQKLGLEVRRKVASGPLGGDQEIGALVAQNRVSGVFFSRTRSQRTSTPPTSRRSPACAPAAVRNQRVGAHPRARALGAGVRQRGAGRARERDGGGVQAGAGGGHPASGGSVLRTPTSSERRRAVAVLVFRRWMYKEERCW